MPIKYVQTLGAVAGIPQVFVTVVITCDAPGPLMLTANKPGAEVIASDKAQALSLACDAAAPLSITSTKPEPQQFEAWVTVSPAYGGD